MPPLPLAPAVVCGICGRPRPCRTPRAVTVAAYCPICLLAWADCTATLTDKETT
jgi:hypothetical protein